jgi:anoctamin-10
LKELELGEIELFDDYLEMIMTYGYITLFASAFPFGSTITCLFIFIEIRSDIFKFEKTARRPFATKTHDIGTWQFALNALTYGSIFTNLILCCFASD